MTLIDEIRQRNESAQEAARELGTGLMRGNRDELKLGYSYENASLSAIHAFALPKLDATELRCYLLGYACGLLHEGIDAIGDVPERLALHSERFAAAIDEGLKAGLEQDRTKTYPATIDGFGVGAPEPDVTEPFEGDDYVVDPFEGGDGKSPGPAGGGE